MRSAWLLYTVLLTFSVAGLPACGMLGAQFDDSGGIALATDTPHPLSEEAHEANSRGAWLVQIGEYALEPGR